MSSSRDPAGALDRRAIRRSFDRAGAGYDAVAVLQAEVRGELLQRLGYFRLAPRVIVDVGAGTGGASVELKRRYPRATVIALDVAPGMLAIARRRSRPWRRVRALCADAAALPLAAHSVDLVYSSLMLQWCEPLHVVLGEWQRVLRPGGLALFSSFGPETLQELRAAWAAVDDAEHISRFVPVPALAAALAQSGLAEPVLDVDLRRRHHTGLRELFTELKTLGAHNAQRSRGRGLTTPRQLARLTDSYDCQRTPLGLPSSWEVIYGAAFAGARGAEHGAGGVGTRDAEPGVVRVPVTAIGRRRR